MIRVSDLSWDREKYQTGPLDSVADQFDTFHGPSSSLIDESSKNFFFWTILSQSKIQSFCQSVKNSVILSVFCQDFLDQFLELLNDGLRLRFQTEIMPF